MTRRARRAMHVAPKELSAMATTSGFAGGMDHTASPSHHGSHTSSRPNSEPELMVPGTPESVEDERRGNPSVAPNETTPASVASYYQLGGIAGRSEQSRSDW